MESRNTYEWAQSKISEVTGYTKEQRESAACQRRLRQMEAKRKAIDAAIRQALMAAADECEQMALYTGIDCADRIRRMASELEASGDTFTGYDETTSKRIWINNEPKGE